MKRFAWIALSVTLLPLLQHGPTIVQGGIVWGD
jgi:hypothetical protein